ncbi:Ferric siderophore transport system, periplasmic binding protein TonB [plant metagenome]|uniref:Ferric siderophore transport system, periplasmic binding protein TonB n=1 Tax=plant metagenome TaxID=1297885 RepID=A0A484U7C0_9ZZZZ
MSSNIPEPPNKHDPSRSPLSDLLDEKPAKPSPRRFIAPVVGVVLLAVGGYFIWQWANDMAGIKREAPKLQAIIPLPPPPPPPPEPEKPPEPEEPKEEKVVEPEPEPTPVEEPKPADEAPPSPSDDLANPMQIDGEAQAGSDAFNIGAGSGGGMAGSGGGRGGNATYGQYMSYALSKILRENDETKNLAFRVQVRIWLTASGQISRVELDRSSGNAEVDAKVVAALRAHPAVDERPPASLAMPVRASLSGRRPS